MSKLFWKFFVPPNTTDLLQPLDISVNKPAKSFLRQKFDEWYASEVFKELNTDNAEMEPVDMCLPVMKECFVNGSWKCSSTLHQIHNL